MRQLFFIVFCSVLILDQLTKYLAGDTGQLNGGISFGIAPQSNQLLFALIISIVMVVLWFGSAKIWHTYPVVAGFFFGGGVSNLIDRLLFGGVRDWLPVPGFNLTNNIADWAISVAIAALILLEIKAFFGLQPARTQKEENEH